MGSKTTNNIPAGSNAIQVPLSSREARRAEERAKLKQLKRRNQDGKKC